MAGEIYFLASAEEIKKLKEDPDLVRQFDRAERKHIDLSIDGDRVDDVLYTIMDEKGDPALKMAVRGGEDIGSPVRSLKYVSAAEAGRVANALSGVSREDFRNAMFMACGGLEEMNTVLYPLFERLSEFYRLAKKKRKAVLKTIY